MEEVIRLNEYVYESLSGNLEISFKCFPHLSSDEDVRANINRFFKKDMNAQIDDHFYSDPYLALTYTLSVELYKISVLVTGEGKASTIMEDMQKHIKRDLKLRGVFLNWINFKDKKLFMKHDGLIY